MVSAGPLCSPGLNNYDLLTWFLVLKIHRLLTIIATLLEVQVAISYRFVKIIWVIFSVKLHFGRLCKLLQTPDVLVTSNLFQKSVKWQIIQNNHPLGVIICRCRLFHFFSRLLWKCNNFVGVAFPNNPFSGSWSQPLVWPLKRFCIF